MKFLGVVLRSSDTEKSALFYKALGLDEQRKHAHGGPVHTELCVTDDVVLELYNASRNYSHDALMFEVTDLDDSLRIAKEHGGRIKRGRPSKNRLRYVTDPDGRNLLLIEAKP